MELDLFQTAFARRAEASRIKRLKTGQAKKLTSEFLRLYFDIVTSGFGGAVGIIIHLRGLILTEGLIEDFICRLEVLLNELLF